MGFDFGGAFDFISDIATKPFEWLVAEPTKLAGSLTGINELKDAGNFLKSSAVENALFGGAAAAAAPWALSELGAGFGSMFMPEGMFFGDPATEALIRGGQTAAGASGGGSMIAPTPAMDTLAQGGMTFGNAMPGMAPTASAGGPAFTPPMMASPAVAGWDMGSPSGGGDTATIPNFMNNTVDHTAFNAGGPNAYNPGVIDMAKDSVTGAWDALPGMAKWAIPIGTATNLATGFMQQGQADKTAEQMGRYLSDTSWDDTKRANTMKGIMGQINEMVTGSKRRAASSGANLGRGGGFYGNKVNQAHEAAREEAAKALAKTYGPSNANPAAYQALAQAEGFNPWMNFTKGIADTAGKWPYLMLMDKIWQ